MGNWFENMEPMNIQEERANTKRERERADQAEEKLNKAQEELSKTEEILDKIESERDKAEKTVIDLLKKLVGSKDLAIKNLVESYDKTEDEAQKLVEKYW